MGSEGLKKKVSSSPGCVARANMWLQTPQATSLGFSFTLLRLVVILVLMVALFLPSVQADWPPAVGPFMDKCSGKQQALCLQTIDVTDNIGSALKFFSFSYGVHLCEGTMKKDYYNVLVDECAKLCVESALSDGNRRCLSFDFYPFEDPWYAEPWLESPQAGVCSLNTGNPDTGRVRNEDQGLTDAELFYQSHFTHRPVSHDSGLYVLRDARGDSIGDLLEYGAGGEVEDLRTINLWGKSRWGIFHFNINTKSARFSGGFTPVDLSQRCPGMLTKNETEALCASAGGRLCTEAELEGLKGRKLGCSLDGFAVWAKENANKGKKFARCCADYEMPMECAAYISTSRLSFCQQQKELSDCTSKASGTTQQNDYGFGHMLDQFRTRCSAGEFGSSCQGAMMRPWYFRERCLWCPRLGEQANAGECRPGGDFGICAEAPVTSKVMFGYNLWKVCGKEASCFLKKAYGDIRLPEACE